jgi:hypothetical protein
MIQWQSYHKLSSLAGPAVNIEFTSGQPGSLADSQQAEMAGLDRFRFETNAVIGHLDKQVFPIYIGYMQISPTRPGMPPDIRQAFGD